MLNNKFLIFVSRLLKMPSVLIFNKTRKALYKRNVNRFFGSFFNKNIVLNEFNDRLEIAPVFTEREKKRMRREYLFWWHFMGLEPEEYFLNNYYEESLTNKFRNVSRWRMGVFQVSVNQGEDRKYLDDKRLFNARFKDFLGRDYIEAESSSKEEIEAFLKDHSTVFIKPIDGSSGRGVYSVEWNNETEENQQRLVEDLIGKCFLLEEKLEQTGWLNKLNPSCVNTIRMNTLRYPDGRVEFVNAFLRTGRKGKSVDNAHAGGILWHANALNGEITYGCHAWGKKLTVHPDSSIQLSGQKIPRFAEAVELVKKAAQLVPSIAQVGWDVVISEDGISLIEGNSGSGIWNMSSKTKPWTMFKKYLYKYNVKI